MFDISSLFELSYEQTPEIIVYSEFTNNRLIYILDFIIKRVWKKNYFITNDSKTFEHSDKIKINYSEKFIQDAINIYPLSLLNSNGVDKNYYPDFSVSLSNYYPEDIFSKVFYFISRYEEWQKNYTKDIHGRYERNASIFKNELHQPIIDISIAELKSYIKKYYPNFETKYFYKEVLTFDLDNILAFKGKGLFRTAAAFIKHGIQLDFKLLHQRTKTLFQNQHDPFEEVYQFIFDLSKHYPVIFFILCKSNTKFDRAADIHHPYTKKILNHLKTFAHIGIHPSYYTFNNSTLIQSEKNILESVIQQKIISGRQHYLRTDIAVTPHLLIQAGIQYDFTLGFASDIGFRAGTSYPFYYYDFNNEKITPLLFIPFSVMDGAYFNYQNISTDQAIQSIQNIKNTIKKTGGYFIPLFHEITLCPLFTASANEWRKVFE